MEKVVALLSISTAVLVADAHAQPPGATVREAPAARGPTSYRRQVMIADGLAMGTVAGAVAAGAWLFEPDDFHLPMMVGGLGFTSFVITAPVIHFAHRNVGRGFLSGGARILFPAIAGVALTTAMGLEDRDDGYSAAFGAGLAIGGLGAIALDWFVLTPSAASAHRPPLVAPRVSASAGHVFLGVGGSL